MLFLLLLSCVYSIVFAGLLTGARDAAHQRFLPVSSKRMAFAAGCIDARQRDGTMRRLE